MSEFFNSSVRQVTDEFNINHFAIPTSTPSKASMAERAIRTLKSRLWRYFQHHNTKRWIDVLSTFVDNYNSTPHSTTGLAPNDVTEKNRKEVYKRMYPHHGIKIECKHRVGDLVRTKLDKGIFPKGYTPNWSQEIYIIVSERQSEGVCWYKLADQSGKSLPGIYYSEELNLVSRK